MIHVEVKNPSRLPDNRMMFEGWSPTAPQRWVRLTDDQQKACPAKEADPANTVANMLPIKIKAGTPAHDVLLFEAPSPKAKYLRLELSGEAFQKEGTAYFKIPASMISGVPTAADLRTPKPVKKAVVKRPAPSRGRKAPRATRPSILAFGPTMHRNRSAWDEGASAGDFAGVCDDDRAAVDPRQQPSNPFRLRPLGRRFCACKEGRRNSLQQ